MEAALLVWLISLLDIATGIFFAIAVTAFIYLVVKAMAHSPDTKEDEWKPFPWKTNVVVIAISSILCAITPSTQTGYMMVGAYFGQSIVQSEESRKVYDLIIKKIEKDLEEAK